MTRNLLAATTLCVLASATWIHADEPANTTRDKMGRSVRALRQEVQDLRGEVRRLTELVEKKPNAAPSTAVIPASATEEKKSATSEAHIAEAINRRLETSVRLDLDEAPLDDFARRLAQECGVNVMIDGRGLEEAGLSSSSRIALGDAKVVANAAAPEGVPSIRARTLLTLALRPVGLTWLIEDGVLKITSQEAAAVGTIVRTYPAADLVVPFKPETLEGQKAKIAPAAHVDFHALVGLVTKTVRPTSWEGFGGPGSVRTHEATLSLVVRQTSAAHDEIADFLSGLRREKDVQVNVCATLLWERADEARTALRMTPEQFTNVVSLTAKQADALVARAERQKGHVEEIAQVTAFNGQLSPLPAFTLHGDKTGPRTLTILPVVVTDRRATWLSLQLRDASRKAVRLSALASPVRVWDGAAALIDVTPDTADEASPLRNYLLLRPRIIVQEEEEEIIIKPVP